MMLRYFWVVLTPGAYPGSDSPAYPGQVHSHGNPESDMHSGSKDIVPTIELFCSTFDSLSWPYWLRRWHIPGCPILHLKQRGRDAARQVARLLRSHQPHQPQTHHLQHSLAQAGTNDAESNQFPAVPISAPLGQPTSLFTNQKAGQMPGP